MPEEVSPQHDNAVSKPLDSLQDVIHKTRSDTSCVFANCGSSYVRSPRSQFRAFALHNGSARISFRTVRPFNIAERSQFFHSCEVAKQHRKNKKALAEAGASWSDEAHAAGHLGDHAGPTRKERPLRNGFSAVCA